MTQLMSLYRDNPEAAKKKIKEMDAGLLLAELDDTIQMDLMRISNVEWATLPRDKAGVYRAIASEIYDRLHKLEYSKAGE